MTTRKRTKKTRMKMRNDNEDVPKLVASIMVAIPGLTIKSGFAYLRLRRQAHNSSKAMLTSMVNEGIPEEYAKRLCETYAADLSVKRFIRGVIQSSPNSAPKAPPKIHGYLL